MLRIMLAGSGADRSGRLAAVGLRALMGVFRRFPCGWHPAPARRLDAMISLLRPTGYRECNGNPPPTQTAQNAIGTRIAVGSPDLRPRTSPMPVTNQALSGGYQLLNYRIDRQISRGGFSIVYRAFDETGAPVAIKEYLPSSLVLRTEGDIVRASSAENLTSFRYGMKCFFEEGRALAKINHPNVVRVLNFFRANETVYMVMRYERGRTLQQQIQMKQDQMSERFVRHVFMHLLNGLREVHTHKLLHLDIKPANIYLRTDGSPVLLDFGAARQTLTSNRPKLAPMYTPGFAAPEQYREPDRLGPWTDVYGTGASMFACLAAFAPQAADARLQEDHLVSAKKIWAGQYSDNVLEVIDWCLRLDPLERPQSVFALQKAIRDIAPRKRKLTFIGNLKRVLFSEIGMTPFAERLMQSALTTQCALFCRCHERQAARGAVDCNSTVRRRLRRHRSSGRLVDRLMRFTIFQESRKGSRKVNQDRIAYTYGRDTLMLVRRRRHGRARGRRDRRADRGAAVHRAVPAGGEADPAQSAQVPAGHDAARACGARVLREPVLDAGDAAHDLRRRRRAGEPRVLGARR